MMIIGDGYNLHFGWWPFIILFPTRKRGEGKGREGKGSMFHSCGVGRWGNEGHKETTDAYQIMNAMPTTPNSPSTSARLSNYFSVRQLA